MTEGELRTLIAKAALDEAAYDALGDGWVDAKRLPDGVDPEDWDCEPVEWDYANDHWRENGYRIADKVLAVFRPHLGLGVTLTAEEIEHITSMLDWYFTDAKRRARPEQLAAIEAFKRWAQASAIAGRGEGTAEGENDE